MKQKNFRLTSKTIQQIEALADHLGSSEANAITVAVDRMFNQTRVGGEMGNALASKVSAREELAGSSPVRPTKEKQ